MHKTLVSVHGYAGDAGQIKNNLLVYEHHKMPVVIFSPEDSRIGKMGPHICRFGGKRQYIGAESLQRQQIQLRMLLDYPFDFFLANDSDSFCISPDIPEYLFKERGVLWSNEVSDTMHPRNPGYAYPRLAFQPPYFFSRDVIVRLLKAKVEPDPTTPFIDWVMMAWAIATNCPHKNFRDGFSCSTADHHGSSVMAGFVLNQGKVMLHSIKTARVLHHLLACRKRYVAGHPVKKVGFKSGYPVYASR